MIRTRKAQTITLIFIVLVFTLPVCSMAIFKVLKGQSAVELGLTDLELAGITFNEPKPQFSLNEWFNRSFQDKFNKWFNHFYGARALFVRLGNQINYSVFSKSYMYDQSIIIGKEKQLYEVGYVRDYCGLTPSTPFIQAERRVKEMKEIQERLREHGVEFTLLITPSKAAIYPEYIPTAFCEAPQTASRDYTQFLPLLDKYQLNYIDGHALTSEAKQKEIPPLFCQGGTHWNYLGAFYTVQPLVEQFGALTKKSLGVLRIQDMTVDHSPTGSDSDLAKLLNLAIPPYDYSVPHPAIVNHQAQHRLDRATFIGGSFTWIVLDIINRANLFDQIDFYYYYKLTLNSYPSKESRPVDTAHIDWNNDFFASKILVLEVNEAAFQMEYLPAFISDILQHLRNEPPQ